MASIKRLSLKGNVYRPLRISKENAKICWQNEFQATLHELAGDLFPRAEYVLGGDDPHVLYVDLNRFARSRFAFVRTGMPSDRELRRLQSAIDKLHARANECDIPFDKQLFLRNFQLPNPHVMPECWLTTPGLFGLFFRKTYVLWGLEKVGVANSTFHPLASSEDKGAANVPGSTSLGQVFGAGKTGCGSSGNSVGGSGSGAGRKGCFRNLLRALSVAFCVGLCAMLMRSCIPGCRMPLGGIGGFSPGGGIDLPLGEDVGETSGSEGDEPKGPEQEEEKSDSINRLEGKDELTSDTPEATEEEPRNPEQRLYSFRVDKIADEEGGTSEFARVRFGIRSISSIGNQVYEVKDWQVNGRTVQLAGEEYSPSNGLRYDKSYTITATVLMKGRPQSVEPFQWNMIDEPTWQIFEVGKTEDGKRQYRLRCCNSSLVKPKVTDWNVSFASFVDAGREQTLNFQTKTNIVDDQTIAITKNLEFFEGGYFMEMSAKIHYTSRSIAKEATHKQRFSFAHDSSAEGLTRVKYELAVPSVYFCLAKTSEGGMLNGTAFAVTPKYLLTNYHVAVGGIPESYADKSDYKVTGLLLLTNAKGGKFHAKVVASDRGRDLALLRICDESGNDVNGNLPSYLSLAEDSLVDGLAKATAKNVFAIGYPKGTVMLGLPAYTDGKVERVLPGNGGRHETIVNYTDIEHGYSGGPLIDYRTGTVLGVNFGGMREFHREYKGACFATTVREVRKVFRAQLVNQKGL